MPSLVVTAQGAQLRCSNGQVLVEHERAVIQRLPQAQVERVLLLGAVGLSTGFIQFALAGRIPVTFLTREGGFKGRLDPGGLREVALRLAQYRGLLELPWRLGIASAIVQAKISSERSLLLRSHRNRPEPALLLAARELEEVANNLSKAATLPALMGRE